MTNILKTAFFVLFCVFGISAIVINELRVENTNLNTEVTELQELKDRILLEHENIKLELAQVSAELAELKENAGDCPEMVATLQARVDILEYDNESYNMLCQVLFDKDVAHITARHLEKIGDTIPERLYGGAASEGSKILLSVEFPSNIKHIGTSAFGYCSNLESVVFNEGLETIDGYAFRNCQKLKMNGLPSTLTSIGDYAFYNCNKMSGLVLPSGLTSIGTAAFSGCTNMFTNIVIPVGVVELTSQVFYGCKTLESVVIHTGVTTIGSSAFYGCSALATIYYEGTVAEWNNITLDIDWDRNCGSGTESGCYTIVYDYMFEIAA